MRKRLSGAAPSIALALGFLAVVQSAPARADVQISLSADGTNWSKNLGQYDSTDNSRSYSNSNFNGSGLGISMLTTDSNSPGSSGVAYLEGGNLHIVNNGAGAATLDILLSDTGFDTPLTTAGSIHIDSSVSATVAVGKGGNSMTFQSYLDPGNALNGEGIYTPGQQSVNITNDPSKGPSSSDVGTDVPHGRAVIGPYSITELFQITLAAGSRIGFSSTTTLTDPPLAAPEPSTLFLAGLGVLGFVGYGLRHGRGRVG